MQSLTVIGIGHKKGAGKDTVANRLVDNHGFIKLSFADPLKDSCRIIFHFTEEQLYGSQKEVIDKHWGKSPREILQLFGTEALRDSIDQDVWIKSLQIKIEKLALANPNKHLKIVIPDVRFPNEAKAIKKMNNGYLWKVNRKINENKFSTHLSEIALDDFTEWDSVLNNDSTMAELYSLTTHTLNLILDGDNNTYANNRRKTKGT